MSHDELAGHYRRLLRWYPAEHRAEHGEEMVGVLLAAARPGQRHPDAADAFNLRWGGLRISARGWLTNGLAGPGWRDTLAVASLIIPLYLFFTLVAEQARVYLIFIWPPGHVIYGSGPGLPPVGSLWFWLLAGYLVMGALAVIGLRRAALAAAVLTAVVLGVALAPLVPQLAQGGLAPSASDLSLLLVEVAALALSPGPRQGRRLLGWRGCAGVALLTMAITLPCPGLPPGLAGPVLVLLIAAGAPAALICVALAVPGLRRGAALFAVPVCYFTVGEAWWLAIGAVQGPLWSMFGRASLPRALAFWAPLLALLVAAMGALAVAAARGLRRGSVPAGGEGA